MLGSFDCEIQCEEMNFWNSIVNLVNTVEQGERDLSEDVMDRCEIISLDRLQLMEG